MAVKRYPTQLLDQLRVSIRTMSRESLLYKILRDELKKRDNWKQKRRGNPDFFRRKAPGLSTASNSEPQSSPEPGDPPDKP